MVRTFCTPPEIPYKGTLDLTFDFEEKDFLIDFPFEKSEKSTTKVILSNQIEEVKIENLKRTSVILINLPSSKDQFYPTGLIRPK